MNEGVLVVAGHDPSGHAGLTRDLNVLAGLEVRASSVVTAITFQNRQSFLGFEPLPAQWLDAQLDAVLAEAHPRFVKVGMLGTAAAVRWAAHRLPAVGRIVLDPVLGASAGGGLIDAEGWEALKRELLPSVHVATPNLQEATALAAASGLRDMGDMKDAASAIHALGCGHVVVTGGHLAGDPIDLWFDGRVFMAIRSARIPAAGPRGLGTVFSTALTGLLARGLEMGDALIGAKECVLAVLSPAGAPCGGKARAAASPSGSRPPVVLEPA